MNETTALRRCVECGLPQREIRTDVSYDRSGLNNVQLLNVPAWVCENAHREILIPAMAELHDLLAHDIVRQPNKLAGAEIRFLRKQLGLSSKEFARRIGISPIHLSRIENGQRRILPSVDLLVRLFYANAKAALQNEPLPDDMLPVLERLERAEPDHHTVAHVDPHDDKAHEWLILH